MTAEDMLHRWEASVGRVADQAEGLRTLEAYVAWLERQRLGTVLRAACDAAGVLAPVSVADHLPAKRTAIPD